MLAEDGSEIGREIQAEGLSCPGRVPFKSANEDLWLPGMELPPFENPRVEIHDLVLRHVPAVERPLLYAITTAAARGKDFGGNEELTRRHLSTHPLDLVHR